MTDSNSSVSIMDSIVGGAIIVGASICSVILVADDAAGLGTIDDAAIPALIGLLAERVNSFAS